MVTDQLRIKSLYAAWHEETRRKQGFVWTSENIDTWIVNSKAMIPDSPMSLAFQGIPDAAERADIIAYLKTQQYREGGPFSRCACRSWRPRRRTREERYR